MTDQLKIQGVVEMSAEGAESALDRVGEKAGQMAERLQREGQKAGAAVDGIGSGADKSAEQFSRAEGKIAASIKRATTNLEQLGKTASQKLEFQINEKGLDTNKFQPLLAKLRELEAANVRVGMSAAQTTAALRNVPAQMTDVVVSLASGQQPLTVLLQQGGQLKDMFGGVGAAAKAIGGYVAGLVNPFTLAAAAAGGIGYAFYSGSSEADEFRKNLVLTGNAAGLTVDRFNAMSKAIGGIDGVTRGAAAEALTAMAASGNIGAASIERLTTTALRFQQAGGPAVADTVKQFEALGKEPVKASLELSDKTHYLTLAVYEQIKALQDQGKTSEAAAVAQNAWADAIANRTPQMVANIGLLESAWKGVKGAATGAWDWAKDIGRDETDAEKMLRLQRTAGRASMALDDPTRYFERDRLKAIKEAADNELKILTDASKKKQELAKGEADAAAKNKAQVAAAVKYDKLIDDQESKAGKRRKEQQQLDADRAAGLVSEEKYQQAKAAIAKKYEEKAKPDRQAAREEKVYETLLDGMRKRLGTAEQLNEVEKLNVEMQEKKYAKLNPAQKESLRLIAEQIDAQKRAESEGKATLEWIANGADAQKKAVKALNDEIEKTARDVATYGMSKSAVAAYDLRQVEDQIAAEKALNEEIGVGSSELLRSLEKQRDKRQELLEQASKLDHLDAGKKAAEEAAKAAQKVAAEWEKAIDRIDQAFHDAFVKSIESASNGIDAFADSLRTSLKAAVADGLYQLTVKPIVVGFMGALSGGAAASSAQGAGGAVAAQQGLGILSGVQAAWSGVNGGVANAATAFATSGFGQAAGLSAAPVELAGPTMTGEALTGTALTGAGSSFVSSAGPYAAALAALIYGDNLMKAGWGLDNNRKGYAASAVGATAGGVIAGMAAGASSGASAGSTVGPWGTVIGAVVGAIAVPVLSRLFGHNRNTNADATGVQGTFDLSGFSGDQWQQFSKKGGTFRSDRRWTDTFGVTSDIDKALDSSFTQAVAKMQDMGKTLGVEAVKSIEGFQHTFSLQLSDNGDMSKAGEKLAEEITKAADEIAARMIPNIDEFRRLGETASQTFERLNSEVEGTNAILLAMGKDASTAFGAVGLASIKAREDLIDLAGGLDKLASKTQSYYANFYTSEEQVQRAATQAQKVLDKGFADLILPEPTDRNGFKNLVESYGADLSTESNRRYFNALLDLQDEFDAVADSAEADAKKLKDASTTAQQGQASLFDVFATDSQKLAAAQKLISDAFAGLGKSVPATAGDFLDLAKAIDPATEAGQSLIATLQKVSGAFSYVEKSAADSAAAKVAAAQAASQAAAQAAQEAAQAAAQSSGSRRSVMDQFDPAGALSRAQTDIAATFAKHGATDLIPTSRAGVSDVAGRIDTSTALGQQQMADLASLSGAFDAVFGAQESAARSAADAAKQAADEQARLAQQAADAAQRAAEDQMRAAQRAADEQMRLATQVHDSISGALRSLLGQSEQFENQSRQMAQATLQSALVIAKAGGSLSNFQGLDAALASVNKLDKATFATAAGYAVEFGRTANLLTQLEQYTRINGSHANGLDYVPFDGYVAQLHRGEKVLTASESAAASATADEVKALRSDLNAIGAALATNTQRTTRLLEKFDVEGIYTRV